MVGAAALFTVTQIGTTSTNHTPSAQDKSRLSSTFPLSHRALKQNNLIVNVTAPDVANHIDSANSISTGIDKSRNLAVESKQYFNASLSAHHASLPHLSSLVSSHYPTSGRLSNHTLRSEITGHSTAMWPTGISRINEQVSLPKAQIVHSAQPLLTRSAANGDAGVDTDTGYQLGRGVMHAQGISTVLLSSTTVARQPTNSVSEPVQSQVNTAQSQFASSQPSQLNIPAYMQVPLSHSGTSHASVIAMSHNTFSPVAYMGGADLNKNSIATIVGDTASLDGSGMHWDNDAVSHVAGKMLPRQSVAHHNATQSGRGSPSFGDIANHADGPDIAGQNSYPPDNHQSDPAIDEQPQSISAAAELAALQIRDKAVRAHEHAHLMMAGHLAQSPHYSYQRGSDGRRYAVDGEVSIDIAPIPGDPEATIIKMRKVYAAALAPVDPSLADLQVAQQAMAQIHDARRELMVESGKFSLLAPPTRYKAAIPEAVLTSLAANEKSF